MHCVLIVLGKNPDKQIGAAARKRRLFDYALLGWGAAKGCIKLRTGAKGKRGSDLLRKSREVPTILLEHDRSISPRLEDGVDQARKGDIASLRALVELARPAVLVVNGSWVLPGSEEDEIPLVVSEGWFDQATALLEGARDEDLVSVYDVHL